MDLVGQIGVDNEVVLSEVDATFISLALDAIDRHRLLRLDYVSKRGATERLIEASLVIFSGTAWYIYGWCRLRQEWRTFRVSRIRALEIDPQVFDPKESFHKDLLDLSNSDYTPYRGVRVTLNMDATASQSLYVLAVLQGSIEPQKKRTRLQLLVPSYQDLLHVLIASGLDFQVEDSMAFKEYLATIAARICPDQKPTQSD